MTIKKLLSLFEQYNIPDDATLMSDSGWECCPTDMNGIFYNEKKNEITFTQGFWTDIPYHIGQKCLYCFDLDKNRYTMEELKSSYQVYIDSSRIVRSYWEEF